MGISEPGCSVKIIECCPAVILLPRPRPLRTLPNKGIHRNTMVVRSGMVALSSMRHKWPHQALRYLAHSWLQ